MAATISAKAIAWYEELADRSLDPSVDAHLAILYGEAGERACVAKMTAGWETRGGMLAALAPIVNTAYLGTAGDGRGRRAGRARGCAARRAGLPIDWPWPGPAAGRRRRAAGGARRALEARGRRLLVRARSSRLANLALVGVGAAALIAGGVAGRRGRPGRRARAAAAAVADGARRGRGDSRWGGRRPGDRGPPVSVERGAARGSTSIIRCSTCSRGRSCTCPVLLAGAPPPPAPRGTRVSRCASARVVRGGARSLVLVAVATIAAGALLTTLLTLAGTWLGVTSHWSEWFDEELASATPARFWSTRWGPWCLAPSSRKSSFVDLFATLRAPCGRPRPSCSAGRSSEWPRLRCGGRSGRRVQRHAVGVGLREDSILPGMAAHAVANLLVTLTVLRPAALTGGRAPGRSGARAGPRASKRV